MNEINIKQTVENLIDTFLDAGRLSLELRKKGLIKKIKSDNTQVSNGDLEVDKLITRKINQLNPDIPLVSEETSMNKLNTNLKNFWLVDPIDGTYDYINNLDEFTINDLAAHYNLSSHQVKQGIFTVVTGKSYKCLSDTGCKLFPVLLKNLRYITYYRYILVLVLVL